MSDSELSEAPQTPVPSDNELEQSLRKEVVRIQKSGDDLSIKAARTASEKRLGLTEGFYKGHEVWKDKSKDIITDQVENEADVASSPVASKKEPSRSLKRPSPASEADARSAPKKQKTAAPASDEDLSSSLSDVPLESEPERKWQKSNSRAKASKAAPATRKPSKKRKSVGIKDASDSATPKPQSEKPTGKNGQAEQSESEMSEVLDEAPKPKKQRGKSSETKPSKARPAKKAAAEDDPDQAEIKRLQGWLVKCGIRKIWGKELKPFEKPKAKIKHLRDMLLDAGMSGRYSNEKASQIKEARELAADIEAVQEGDERWGTGDKEVDGDEEDRPARKLVRGSRHLDFLSSDGEETD